jgi:hypothetical protein
MPTTTQGLFTNEAQDNLNGGTVAWTSLANVVTEAGEANAIVGPGDLSFAIRLDTPLNAGEIPPGSLITGFTVYFFERADGDNGHFYQANAGGATREVIGTAPLSVRPLGGNLLFWGISEAQAKDIASGSAELSVVGGRTTGGGSDMFLQWVKIAFDYIGTGTVSPPVLF